MARLEPDQLLVVNPMSNEEVKFIWKLRKMTPKIS
jgi:hypothetical protein